MNPRKKTFELTLAEHREFGRILTQVRFAAARCAGLLPNAKHRAVARKTSTAVERLRELLKELARKQFPELTLEELLDLHHPLMNTGPLIPTDPPAPPAPRASVAAPHTRFNLTAALRRTQSAPSSGGPDSAGTNADNPNRGSEPQKAD